MTHKKYFSRYRKTAVHGSSSRPAQEPLESENIAGEKIVLGELAPDLSGAVEEQPDSDSIARNAAKEHEGKNAIKGYEKIAPGIYQFPQLTPVEKRLGTLSKLIPPSNPKGACVLGLKRVDGLPGPYQHYTTPVFQFT